MHPFRLSDFSDAGSIFRIRRKHSFDEGLERILEHNFLFLGLDMSLPKFLIIFFDQFIIEIHALIELSLGIRRYSALQDKQDDTQRKNVSLDGIVAGLVDDFGSSVAWSSFGGRLVILDQE